MAYMQVILFQTDCIHKLKRLRFQGGLDSLQDVKRKKNKFDNLQIIFDIDPIQNSTTDNILKALPHQLK